MQVPKTSASQQAASPKTVSQLQLSSLPALATPGQIKGKLGYLARSMMAIRYSFQPEKFAGLAFSQLPAPSSQLPALVSLLGGKGVFLPVALSPCTWSARLSNHRPLLQPTHVFPDPTA
ncbi:hypothetical protein NDA12_005103 [Ustilago hordei]|nr:hypothetical protein NDA12_005103 [Ustilago hordei]KAJ1582194.1 hypothetical protein NDA15_004926 [Ustilago hordei]